LIYLMPFGLSGSLFWKIFLWFGLAWVLIISVVVILIGFTTPEWLLNQPIRIPAKALENEAARSADIFETKGAAALQRHLQVVREEWETSLKLPTYTIARIGLLDSSGRNVTGRRRRFPPADFAQHALQSDETTAQLTLRMILLGHAGSGPSGQRYVLFFATPRVLTFFPFGWRGWLRVTAGWLAAAVGCFWLARYVSKPVSQLKQATKRLAAGDLSTRVTDTRLLRRSDELADFAHAFNEMASRIELLVAAQRRLIADISHEFRSPLTRVNVALGLAGKKADASVAPLLARIESETERLGELIQQLLLLAQLESEQSPGPMIEVKLSELVQEVAADANFEGESQGKRVAVKIGRQCRTYGNPLLIRSALENVIRNAVHYTAESTEVEVELTGHANESRIIIRDQGIGVPEGELTNIFQPFYRVSEARDRQSGGTGLGLAIAQRAVELEWGAGLCSKSTWPRAGSRHLAPGGAGRRRITNNK
jgi:two-component system, OmpR family, sensor histidine kinase CpxA